MNFTDWLRSIFAPYPELPQKREVIPLLDPRPVPAGRTSTDSEGGSFSNNSGWVLQPPPNHESQWRMLNLDVNHLDTYTPKELLDMLSDLSPEISKAIWEFQRLCNPGYEYKAYALGSEDAEHPQAKEHIDEFFGRLRDKHGSIDILLGRFFIGAYLRGAFCGELVLDGSANESLDIASPDPHSIRFRKRADPLFKEVWQPGQQQGGDFVSLDIPTFRYLPVDPAPASPYGRPLAAPALFTSIFILGLLHDVKRVIMQQGYKRMDIVLNSEQAMDNFSYDPQGYASLSEYIQAAMDAVKTAYSRLEPDDAFIHTDIFELNIPAGTIDADSIGAIDKILARLEKMVTRALKSNSLVMDTSNSTSETDSNRRWEIHTAGVKSLQHHCENMLESLLTLSLRAKGIQARVEFRFAELRAAEMLRDEQTKAMQIQNARAMYDAGYVSQDEASNYAVNHDADSAEPRTGQSEVDIVEDNSDGSENLPMGTDRAVDIFEEPDKIGATSLNPERSTSTNGHG